MRIFLHCLCGVSGKGLKQMGTEDRRGDGPFKVLEGLGLSGSSAVGAVILTAEEEGREKKDMSP